MPMNIKDLSGLARERLEYAKSFSLITHEQLHIRLPYLALNINSSNDNYLKYCAKALYTADRNNSCSEEIDIVVSDSSEAKSLSMPHWQSNIPGLGEIYECFENCRLDGLYDPDYQSWQFLDLGTRQGLYLMESENAFPPWEQAFPLRNFLHWAYAAQQKRLIHAASLGINGKGVLLAGAGGAGKSGTTLAGILNGMQSCGDDYIGLEFKDDQPMLFPVMRLMKQDPAGLKRLGQEPMHPQFGSVNWQGKHEFDFNQVVPQSRIDQLSVNAIFLPHISSNTKSSIRAASTKDVMFALMPNNLQQLPGRMKQGFEIISRLSRAVPGFHIELSSDPKEISHVIKDFLSRGMA